MQQSRISAFETPGAANVTLETLSRLAAAFRVGLVVAFVPFSEMLNWETVFDQGTFNVTRLEDDVDFLQPTARAAQVRRRGRRQKRFKSRLVQMPIQGRIGLQLQATQERTQMRLNFETPIQVSALNRIKLSSAAGAVRNLPESKVAAGAGVRHGV